MYRRNRGREMTMQRIKENPLATSITGGGTQISAAYAVLQRATEGWRQRTTMGGMRKDPCETRSPTNAIQAKPSDHFVRRVHCRRNHGPAGDTDGDCEQNCVEIRSKNVPGLRVLNNNHGTENGDRARETSVFSRSRGVFNQGMMASTSSIPFGTRPMDLVLTADISSTPNSRRGRQGLFVTIPWRIKGAERRNDTIVNVDGKQGSMTTGAPTNNQALSKKRPA